MSDKDFTVKNGLIVNTNLIYATGGKVGISNATPDANLTITGTANVQGNFSVTGTTRSTGAAALANTLSVTGSATLSNTLAVTGNTVISNTLSVTGNASFANSVIITGNATFVNTFSVTGNVNFANTLSVTGATTIANTLSVTGAANVLSTFGVSAAANLFSSLGVTGAATLANTLSVTGNVTISNSAIIAGNVALSNTLAVTGATSLSNTLAVTGTVTIGGTTTINGANINVINVNATNLTGTLQTVSQPNIVANNALYLNGNTATTLIGYSTAAYTNALAYAASNTYVNGTFAQNTAAYAAFAQNTAVFSTFAQNTAVYSVFATQAYAASNTYVNGTFATNTYVNSLTNGKVSFSGGTFTGDIALTRSGSGYPDNGALFFGNSGAKYIYWNGTNFSISAPIIVTGSGYFTGDVVTAYSDDRLKTRINNIDNALNKVKALNGFYYMPNDTAIQLGIENNQLSRVGVSAQEVQSILPEAVKPAPGNNKYLTVQYEKLVPLLLEAIKELEQRVAELEKGN